MSPRAFQRWSETTLAIFECNHVAARERAAKRRA
jgi:hypothetical protein